MTAAVERVYPPALLVRIANPILRALVTSPLHGALGGQFLVLHVPGRRSGRTYDVIVAHHDLPGVGLAVLTNSRWRLNLRGGADVEVTWRGRRTPARAELIEEPEAVADVYAERLATLGWEKAQRVGLRITVGRAPTREELLDAVAASGLGVVRLELSP